MNEKVLTERLEESRKKAEAIVELVETETRSMTEAEKADFDAHIKECERLEGEIEGIARLAAARTKLEADARVTHPARLPPLNPG